MRRIRLFALPLLVATGWTAPATAASEKFGASGPWNIYRDVERGKCRMITIVGKVMVALEIEPGTDTARLFTTDESPNSLSSLAGVKDGDDVDMIYDFGLKKYPAGAVRIHRMDDGKILLHSAFDAKDFVADLHGAPSMLLSRNGTVLINTALPGWGAALDATVACATPIAKPTAPSK